MPIITTLQDERERFEKTSFKWVDLEDGKGVYILASQVKSFLTQSHIRLLESLKEELPKEKSETWISNAIVIVDNESKVWNSLLSTIHQLIDNAIKSIEN